MLKAYHFAAGRRVRNTTQSVLNNDWAPSPKWVKLRRTQYEHMFSALPSNPDIARRSRHVSKVPEADYRYSMPVRLNCRRLTGLQSAVPRIIEHEQSAQASTFRLGLLPSANKAASPSRSGH